MMLRRARCSSYSIILLLLLILFLILIFILLFLFCFSLAPFLLSIQFGPQRLVIA